MKNKNVNEIIEEFHILGEYLQEKVPQSPELIAEFGEGLCKRSDELKKMICDKNKDCACGKQQHKEVAKKAISNYSILNSIAKWILLMVLISVGLICIKTETDETSKYLLIRYILGCVLIIYPCVNFYWEKLKIGNK